ncbi:hypothetical protein ACGFX8_37280 [Streptomyces sp. NPDC048362]|uniref:hypothetical protein n=1 Tax=Streptomyces sp. NPDC048362 TaxID=3365539 RepID=UPI00371364C2
MNKPTITAPHRSFLLPTKQTRRETQRHARKAPHSPSSGGGDEESESVDMYFLAHGDTVPSDDSAPEYVPNDVFLPPGLNVHIWATPSYSIRWLTLVRALAGTLSPLETLRDRMHNVHFTPLEKTQLDVAQKLADAKHLDLVALGVGPESNVRRLELCNSGRCGRSDQLYHNCNGLLGLYTDHKNNHQLPFDDLFLLCCQGEDIGPDDELSGSTRDVAAEMFNGKLTYEERMEKWKSLDLVAQAEALDYEGIRAFYQNILLEEYCAQKGDTDAALYQYYLDLDDDAKEYFTNPKSNAGFLIKTEFKDAVKRAIGAVGA